VSATVKSISKAKAKTPIIKPKAVQKAVVKKEPISSKAATTKPKSTELKRRPVVEPRGETPSKQKNVESIAQQAPPAKQEAPHQTASTLPEPPQTKTPEKTEAELEKELAEEIAREQAEREASIKSLEVMLPITVRDLAGAMEIKPTDLIAKLMQKGVIANLNQSIHYNVASNIAKDFGFKIEEPHELERDLAKIHIDAADQSKLKPRPPIVTFMGHVDHGKTSLLDAIRKSKVVDSEAGGITQHVGAYEVFLKNGAVTFLDTPGHEAFTAMRARGARCTDVVVLVIAADSGVQPQTVEAIDHARAAEVPIVVAINKCDLPNANIDRVKKDLTERDLQPEDWGGKTITVNVSAKTGDGIDTLLEMLLLEAELLEIKANPDAPARGTVVEAELSKVSGPTATLLVQDGTLHVSDVVVCGNHYGKVRAMINDRKERVKEAPPSTPVGILGFSGVPEAGDVFFTVKDEVKARELIRNKQEQLRERSLAGSAHITLDDLYEEIKAGKISTLKIVLKADVQGSLEALKAMILQIPSDQAKLSIIHSATGDISQSDIMLASASNAIVIGFHVEIPSGAVDMIKREQVDVRTYNVIYEAQEAIRKALEGLLEPEIIEIHTGTVEVRQVIKISKLGNIAGSKVTKGKVLRNAMCRVFRNGEQIHEGKISGLKRFKNDAREVLEGYECGVTVSNFSAFEEGDEIRCYEIETKARTLNT